ncbi:hypothetical protein AADG42_05550 [Ammonicoccus fulvus]|uniref:Uncharacterized protein n=1 Tax=Ammonicoccus fulvus TaxID=3138240 RepID=A0ABZ3FL72_9ACTN
MAATMPEPAPAFLRLHAISINEVRDLIGADAATRAWAEAEAAVLIPPPAPPQGFLARLFARPGTPQPPGSPTSADLDTLLSGHHAAPERAGVGWQILDHLVGRRAWGSLGLALDARAIADFDFALSLGGVPTDAALGRILRSPARLALTPAPGVSVGYLPCTALRQHADLIAAATIDDPGHAQIARTLAEFLARLPDWAIEAERNGRAAPDVVAFHWAQLG